MRHSNIKHKISQALLLLGFLTIVLSLIIMIMTVNTGIPTWALCMFIAGAFIALSPIIIN